MKINILHKKMKKTYFERYFKKEQRILMDIQLKGLAMDSPLSSNNIAKIDDKKYEKHLCHALDCIHNGDSSDIFDGIKHTPFKNIGLSLKNYELTTKDIFDKYYKIGQCAEVIKYIGSEKNITSLKLAKFWANEYNNRVLNSCKKFNINKKDAIQIISFRTTNTLFTYIEHLDLININKIKIIEEKFDFNIVFTDGKNTYRINKNYLFKKLNPKAEEIIQTKYSNNFNEMEEFKRIEMLARKCQKELISNFYLLDEDGNKKELAKTSGFNCNHDKVMGKNAIDFTFYKENISAKYFFLTKDFKLELPNGEIHNAYFNEAKKSLCTKDKSILGKYFREEILGITNEEYITLELLEDKNIESFKITRDDNDENLYHLSFLPF